MINIQAALSSVVALLRRSDRDDRGATAVEYGLMVALIAAVIAAIVLTLGTSLRDKFDGVNSCVQNNTCPANP